MDNVKSNFVSFVDDSFLTWLKEAGLEYHDKVIPCKDFENRKSCLILLFCRKYCIKLYDCLGHGAFSFTGNLAKKYDESIYDGDFVALPYVFQYFKIGITHSFSERTQIEYRKNIPFFINDLKLLVGKLRNIEDSFWHDIHKFARKQAKILGII